jgi:hypothetical protein
MSEYLKKKFKIYIRLFKNIKSSKMLHFTYVVYENMLNLFCRFDNTEIAKTE